jgi:ferritin-like metal-binding protein YciE
MPSAFRFFRNGSNTSGDAKAEQTGERFVTIENMEDLLEEQLREIYGAERQLAAELPKLIWQTTSLSLRLNLTDQFQEAERRIDRLGDAFRMLGRIPRGSYCHGIRGFLDEGSFAARRRTRGVELDAAVIGCTLRVTQYTMGAYSRAIAYAKLLGQREITDLLTESLIEEKSTVEALSRLAEEPISGIAVHPGPALRQA